VLVRERRLRERPHRPLPRRTARFRGRGWGAGEFGIASQHREPGRRPAALRRPRCDQLAAPDGVAGRTALTASPTPRLVAHRGDASSFPENSLEAIGAALDAGARYVEFDVQLTADGVPVLSHDADLVRCCGRAQSLLETEYSALRGIGAGEPARFGKRFAASRLATLAQAMERVAQAPLASAFVEIKRESLARFGVSAVVDRVLQALAPFPDRYAVISFERAAVERARASAGAPIGWVLTDYDEPAHSAARALRPEYLFCDHRRLPAGGSPLWDGPWKWAVYEVDDPTLALALAARGVALVETFAIGEMLADPRLRTQPRPVPQA